MASTTRVGIAAVLAGASIATLAWVAGRTEAPAKAVQPDAEHLVGAYDRAATQAHGQRVLVIHALPGADATGEVFESARSPEGWRLHPPTPPGADDAAPALASLAAAAAADWQPDARFEKATVRALGYFDVAIVVVEDGRGIIVPDVDPLDPLLSLRGGVPGLGLRKAGPVHHLLAEPEMDDPASDVLEYARRLRVGDAHFTDLEDAGWGGTMRLQAHLESDFLFAWPATGAHVTVNGKPVAATPATLPLLKLRLPEGKHLVRVQYGETAVGGWVAIVAGVVLVVSVLLLLRAFRPPVEPTVEPEE